MDNTKQVYVTLTNTHDNCKAHPQVFAAKSIGQAMPQVIGDPEVLPNGTVLWNQRNHTRKATVARRGRLNRAGRRWLKFSLAGKAIKPRTAVLNIVAVALP